MKIKILLTAFILSVSLAGAETLIVGGSTNNGDFNAPGGTVDKTYAQTPHWVNIGSGSQNDVCLKINETHDGTHNAVLAEAASRLHGLDTGYTIREGDRFSLSYYWKDSWQWTDAGDQVLVRLFVTGDNTIGGTPTDLAAVSSGTRDTENAYEWVEQDGFYTATADAEGKTLFVALDTLDGGGGADGFARVDNFELSVVNIAPVIAAAMTSSNTMVLSWDTIPGSHYTLGQSSNLVDWTRTVEYILADSSTLEEEVPLDPQHHQFYRVWKEPQVGPFVDPETPLSAQPTLNVPTGDIWVLDFSDEFNGTAVDTTKWNIDNSTRSRAARPTQGISDWFWKPQNVSVSGGDLILDVTKQDHNTMWCGSVNSNDKYEPTYGYMEARIRIAETTRSTHTAFWMQGDNMSNVDGTGNDGAEVDIFESAWFGDYTKSVVHIDGYGADHRANTKQYSTPGLHSGYHIFGLEWNANEMKIYYDGVHKVTYTGIWVPQVPERLWLSDGASFGDVGTFTSEAVGWLTSAKVDYIRVWRSN